MTELKEQLPASDFMKEAIELDKMCVSEIVAKYESSHNAITVLKRKFREACESDEWMKSATEFYENGGCPICFSTDEAGCTEGCYLGQLQAKLEERPNCAGCEHFKHTHSNEHCYRYTEEPSLCKLRQEPVEQPPAGERTKECREIISKWGCLDQKESKELCDRLDRSEASRKELLKACEAAIPLITGERIVYEAMPPVGKVGKIMEKKIRECENILEAAIIKAQGE